MGHLAIAGRGRQFVGAFPHRTNQEQVVAHRQQGTFQALVHRTVACQGVARHGAEAFIAIPIGLDRQLVIQVILLFVYRQRRSRFQIVDTVGRSKVFVHRQAFSAGQVLFRNRTPFSLNAVVVVHHARAPFGPALQLGQMVGRDGVRVVLEIAFGRHVRCRRHLDAQHTVGCRRPVAAVLLAKLLADIVARIVSFVHAHCLVVLVEEHSHQFGCPQGRFVASACQCRSRKYAFGIFLQFQVDGHLVRDDLVFQHLHRLMIFQHLHHADGFVGQVLRSQPVAALQQIHPFDIEVRDGFPIIRDIAAFVYLDARHLLQYVANDAVALVGKGTDQIAQRVVALGDFRGAHADFFQLDAIFRQDEVLTLRGVAHHPLVPAHVQTGYH